MLLASLAIGVAVMSTAGPNPSDTSFGSWLAHNEQGGLRSPWKPVEGDIFSAKAWIGPGSEQIDFFDFNYGTINPNLNYSVTFAVDYQCKPDDNAVFGHLATLFAVQFQDGQKSDPMVFNNLAIEVTDGTAWRSITANPIHVTGSGLLSDPTFSFRACQTTDLNSTVWVKVRVQSCVQVN